MSEIRIGHGFDVHRLAKGRDLIIGGVKIEFERGLQGHSDADVLLHAIMDALLGASGLGDIGYHFPPTDEKFKNADSWELLAEVVSLLKDKGYYEIINIDATIIAERPMFRPYIESMRTRIAMLLDVSEEIINICSKMIIFP